MPRFASGIGIAFDTFAKCAAQAAAIAAAIRPSPSASLVRHRFTDPVGDVGRRQRKAKIVQRLIVFGGNMMGAVFVPDDSN
jgi:hypothetical protein